MSGEGGLRERKGLPGPQHLLLYPEPEPEPEAPAPQIPEAPTPDVPIWNIGAFTLLDGRLVLLGGEEEVRGRTWARGGERMGGKERGLRLPLSACLPFLTTHRCWEQGPRCSRVGSASSEGSIQAAMGNLRDPGKLEVGRAGALGSLLKLGQNPR